MSEAESVARALRGQRAGRGWVAFCPAHDNTRTPALSISEGRDGRLLVIDEGDRPGLWQFELSGRKRAAVELGDQLVDPVGLARDDSGSIYVLDRDGERVSRLRSDLGHLTLIFDLAEYLHER